MITVWNIQERREEFKFTGHTHYLTSLAVSADGRFLVSGSEDYTVRVWNMQERREECMLKGHTEVVSSVAVSADGRLIVSGSWDNTIKVWNIQEQKEHTFSDLTHIKRIIISNDGNFIVSKEGDCTVKIWNRTTKQKERFLLTKHGGLLKYMLELFNVVNCEVVITPDLLLIRSAFGVAHTAVINNGDLQFSFDLGVESSKSASIDKNFLHYLNSTDFSTIDSPVADRYSGILRFTLAHYFSYSGTASKLKLLTENDDFVLAVDAFGRSPFYYAIVKKRQDCVDILLDAIECMRLNNTRNNELSILAIRNDIPILIKNSSRQLPLLLSNLIFSSNLIYAKIPEDLPILQVSFAQNPLLTDFPQDGLEEIPIILQHSILPLLGEIGCMHNLSLLDAIANCKNTQALRSPIIRYIVTIQFDLIKNWAIGYSLFLCLNVILLMLLVGLKSFALYLVAPFLVMNAFLFAWEAIQMSTDPKGYFQGYWNWLDIVRTAVSMVWIGLGICGITSLYFTWSVALINLLRGITLFQLFDGTRFYIELIFRSLNDIKYFFLMFAYSTFMFGFLLMISRDQGLGFTSIWGESYDLNFGNYEGTNSGVYFMQYIGYFGATVINVVLMLNLLISILGDSYERFQLEQAVVNIKQKANISMEIQSMMFWTKKKSLLKYIRLCNSAFQDEDEQDWEGRMRFMDKKLDKSIKELMESNKAAETKAAESSKSIETNIAKSNTTLEGRFASVEQNIKASLEGKIASVEGQILAVDSKIASVEDKMNELNHKLEMILNIISK